MQTALTIKDVSMLHFAGQGHHRQSPTPTHPRIIPSECEYEEGAFVFINCSLDNFRSIDENWTTGPLDGK